LKAKVGTDKQNQATARAKNWRVVRWLVLACILLIATIDRGSEAVYEPSVGKCLMSVGYLTGCLTALFTAWQAKYTA